MFVCSRPTDNRGEEYKMILSIIYCSQNENHPQNLYLHLEPLTLKDLFISESCIEINIELNFYFHTSLWCFKRFYETFWGTTNKCENKNLA